MKQGLYTAFVYIGLVIGAGFASGREIMEYFNFPTLTDHSGIVLATFLFAAICYIILSRAYLGGISTGDEYLKVVAGRGAPFMKMFMLLYLFCGFFTMLSGSGALLNQSFLLPDVIGILFLAIFCFLVLSFDLKGIIAVNTVLVPCMVFGIFYICISSAIFGTSAAFSSHGFLKNTLPLALCYVSYNTISAAPVLVPLSKGISPKGITLASVMGGGVLGILILIIWASQSLNFGALWDSELPMLKLAAMTGRAQKYAYTLVLFMAICTTAISQGFGILSSFNIRTFKGRAYASAVLCLIALPFSFLGFSALVKHLYSFFGITGLVWTFFIIIDYIRHRK